MMVTMVMTAINKHNNSSTHGCQVELFLAEVSPKYRDDDDDDDDDGIQLAVFDTLGSMSQAHTSQCSRQLRRRPRH